MPLKKSTIDYFTPMNQSITEYAVVEDMLRCSEVARAAVGQQYIINTFDLGVCMRALQLIWKFMTSTLIMSSFLANSTNSTQ